VGLPQLFVWGVQSSSRDCWASQLGKPASQPERVGGVQVYWGEPLTRGIAQLKRPTHRRGRATAAHPAAKPLGKRLVKSKQILSKLDDQYSIVK
jgi:hypothetical protein